jgi:hypothetical protein
MYGKKEDLINPETYRTVLVLMQVLCNIFLDPVPGSHNKLNRKETDLIGFGPG